MVAEHDGLIWFDLEMLLSCAHLSELTAPLAVSQMHQLAQHFQSHLSALCIPKLPSFSSRHTTRTKE